ncbi:inositol 2-dehydrogenase [Garciella nitratireducens]|uniref:Myo-inositol 2-dehydrogenase / D-chiro-inositol 1-dehydrogenase n=1 Tax=Garciella nitratireducens DSM 15102 TaxID=1121911 RepID=A0A1T4LMV4_9FIRM|nr:inositol 2-dehydrogenase [Garciella nitratireducens]RBP46874.1 myo-inositol 2-dehydrogenase/D-chiro-inositol 1-dehydrogenase [Garciella nitratireducens]SJZ56042.1 myo-inositol 2-dehydrogenase / D-chiro-inositol 1-dehydrogenase [Garciella nitratireducens DSM 15102]
MENIRIGIVGLGRLGKVHAFNISQNIPGACLVAACSLDKRELEYARNQLHVEETYSQYEEMIENSNLDAVCIVSPSGFHAEQIQLAMKKGLHVFSEKPMGLNIKEIENTIKIIDQCPNQVFQLGFMRRYDDSYKYAKKLVDNGEIGELTVIRCYGIDPSSGLESFVKFAKASNSGGLFSDMSIHDIDLVRWFSGKEVNRVWAMGKNAAYPELDQVNELETGVALMQLEDKTMAILVAGRNAIHGYHVETELIGTKGMLRIAQVPEKNLVTIFNEHGMVRPTSQNFPERFREAFICELKEFVECIQKNRQSEVTAYDGLQATKVAIACQRSVDTNQIIDIK